MKLAYAVTALLFLDAPTLAADAPPSPPTVTLTQAELQTLVQAEASKAVADYVMQQAKPVYDKFQAAFASKPAEASPAK